MGAEISMNTNNMVDIKTRRDCTEEMYLDLHWRDKDIIKNNNTSAARYYKTQLKEICNIDYHNAHIPQQGIYYGNIIPNVGRFE